MTEQELQQVLPRLLAEGEGECVEFKDANDNFSTSDIGKYFSALANEANLRGLASAWLVFGVDNKTRTVIGTTYRREHERLHSLKHQIAQGTDPATTFREIHEFASSFGRVVFFEIPAATETEAEYLHHRAFDDTYFCDMIVEYLRKFGSAKRSKFNRLLEGKLSDLLSPAQKRSKIHNLLQRLQREGKIKVSGSTKAAVWTLTTD